MRPTGVALIAVYHFLSALFLVFFAIALAVGGSVLGAVFGGAKDSPLADLASASWSACWVRSSSFSMP